MEKLVKEKVITWFRRLLEANKLIKVGKISEKYDILTAKKNK